MSLILARKTLFLLDTKSKVLSHIPMALPEQGKEDFEKEAKARPELRLQKAWLRFNDILAVQRKEHIELLVSYSFWNERKKCYTSRLSSLAVSKNIAEWKNSSKGWNLIFETSPCLPFIINPELPSGFRGHMAGGSMQLLNSSEIILTVGDYGFDGLTEGLPAHAQKMDSDYGKMLRIHLETGKKKIVSIGHRNAPGIAVDDGGNVWAVEHGPKGEMNSTSLKITRTMAGPKSPMERIMAASHGPSQTSKDAIMVLPSLFLRGFHLSRLLI